MNNPRRTLTADNSFNRRTNKPRTAESREIAALQVAIENLLKRFDGVLEAHKGQTPEAVGR